MSNNKTNLNVEDLQHNYMPTTVLVTVNEEKNRVEIHCRGPFVSPQFITSQLATVYELAAKYRTALVYINSVGGASDNLTEFLSVLELFDCVITVAAGQVCSAGFFLWCAGDVRVVQNHTIFMAHRESYNFEGKTPQHLDMASFNEKFFGRLIDKLCGDILTEDEKQRIRLTEVFLTDTEVIERECGITWEQFIERDNMFFNVKEVWEIDGEDYYRCGSFVIPANSEEDCKIPLSDVIYNLPKKTIINI